jgi:hypothetical protein
MMAPVSMLMLKLFLAPALVVAASLAGRRWGPAVAGTLVALPIVAGPILLITGLEHGSGFAARAAGASLLGLVSLALFAVVFTLLSRIRHWAVTLLLAWASCLAVSLGLSLLAVPPLIALGLSLTATVCGTKALVRTDTGEAPIATPPAWWDLPARAAATALLVTVLTTAASHLGPGLTGVLAPFPIGTSVVATFALVQGGSVAAAATLRGVLRGLWGFAAFCFLVAVLVRPLGIGPAFGLAVTCTIALQLGLGRLQATQAARRVSPAPHPERADHENAPGVSAVRG